MVKVFSRILQMSNFEGLLVQFASYGGYFAPERLDRHTSLCIIRCGSRDPSVYL